MAGHHQWFTIKRLKSLSVSKRETSSVQPAEKIPAVPDPGDDPRASVSARRFSPVENATRAAAAQRLQDIDMLIPVRLFTGARVKSCERRLRRARIAG